MRKFFSAVIMSGVLSIVASGCALSGSDESTPGTQASQYGFTRDSTGQAVRTDLGSLDHFTPAQSFDHTLASKSQQATTDIDPQDVSCSGACDANICVCSGDLDCCIVGCSICWAIVQD